MTHLVVRRLLIDLQPPFAHDWCGDDAFATAFFNALSMSFPFGEQFFIDAVRRALGSSPEALQQAHHAEMQAFIGQEAAHRRVHALFNAHLEAQGLRDGWTPRASKRLQPLADADPRHALAITAATEHFTAMFAGWLLAHPQLLDGAETRLRTMWLWHSAEELEHRSTAFDLYRAVDGSHEWRVRWFRRITTIFLCDLLRQTASNLRREGQFWKFSTWRSGMRLLWGREGLLRQSWNGWWCYLRRDFHPSQQDDALSQRWLADNNARFVPVKTPAPEPEATLSSG
ncbi:putative metal-dependent hydrolase [Variovorax sp. SRS16]|uniref:metal-dependent hydrolase n=1 Tax=Variovorax sp. SRS16 TaxID=282217 RepID=UPI001315FB07|nr:metal-dependent hydrolase [Variovorax sp. SRS16]VTU21753.1 putative metal-dependent hydrolase [Variovorax sp. SRS16]